MKAQIRKRAILAAYWMTTTITALAFLTGGAAYIARAEIPVSGVVALGYPAYVVTILGMWKVLGALAILAPGLPRMKEWAYAGILFNLSGAAFSHAAMGDPTAKVIVPLVLLAIAAVSWALRPASRKLGPAIAVPRRRAAAVTRDESECLV
jgi:hypothetical protein